MRNPTSTRRGFVKGALGLGAGAALSTLGCHRSSQTDDGQPGPAAPINTPDFTFAVLNDPHTFAEMGAPDALGQAVQHALSQARAPEGILAGGDLVMDILATGKEEADAQYDLFDGGVAAAKIPIYPAIGNHDCFGVYADSGVEISDPLFGKGYFKDRFDREPYYSFDHEGWHFVVLDTVGIDPDARSYKGWVDAEQIAWLDDDLASANRPTVVLGHIPLFTNYIAWTQGTAGGIPGGVAVVNSHEVAGVLTRHPVKMVVAGHLHINESFRFKGIEFVNIGAVSGNWWKGPRDGFEEGYSVLEFRGDQVTSRYVDYGWEAQA